MLVPVFLGPGSPGGRDLVVVGILVEFYVRSVCGYCKEGEEEREKDAHRVASAMSDRGGAGTQCGGVMAGE